jgi:hypothetical protein
MNVWHSSTSPEANEAIFQVFIHNDEAAHVALVKKGKD